MSDDYTHLGPAARESIDCPAEERIIRINSRRFTDYPRCRSVLEMMTGQIAQPKGSLKPNHLIWGESGQGKSTIIKKHLREHVPVFDEAAGIRHTPVIGIEMPPMCDVRWFYGDLLRAIDAPLTPARGIHSALVQRIMKLYQMLGVRQIVIDEAHNMLVGSVNQQRAMLAAIRHISNQLEVPLVLVGTRDAREALMHDRQLTRRFRFIELPVWKEGQEFDALVGSVLRSLPLRRPSVVTPRALKTLVSHAEGITACVFETLVNLGVRAIETGEERITSAAIIEYTKLSTAA
jgi:hypothetical protein